MRHRKQTRRTITNSFELPINGQPRTFERGCKPPPVKKLPEVIHLLTQGVALRSPSQMFSHMIRIKEKRKTLLETDSEERTTSSVTLATPPSNQSRASLDTSRIFTAPPSWRQSATQGAQPTTATQGAQPTMAAQGDQEMVLMSQEWYTALAKYCSSRATTPHPGTRKNHEKAETGGLRTEKDAGRPTEGGSARPYCGKA